MKFLSTCALFSTIFFSSLVDAKKECGFVCVDWDWGLNSETIGQRLTYNLQREGPADGVCLNNSKWIINGTDFDLPTKCFCVDIPTDVTIQPGEGEECLYVLDSSPTETFTEYFLRMYNSVKGKAPANGWCPKGEIKWVVRGNLIDKPNDTCYCVKHQEFVSPKVKCVDVPSSSSSSSSSEADN